MSKDQKTVLQIYIAYLASIIMSFIPSSPLSTFGTILFVIIFIATYYYRRKSSAGEFTYTHMQFILKTIWISSLILIVGMAAAYLLANHTIIYQTYESIKGGLFLNEDQINGLIMDYFRANIFVFLLTLSPSLIYLGYRFIKGIIFAKNNQKIENLKSWI